jgi:hypothetical protein
MIHPQTSQFDCLPEDVQLTDLLSATWETNNYVSTLVASETVEQKLIELNACCKNGKLVDGNGREIRFVRLAGGWGTEAPHHGEILAKQSATIEKLMATYTVIQIPYNTGPYLIG